MSVSANTSMSAGIYVQLMQHTRGGHDGGSPVGTHNIEATVTGNSSGGTAEAKIRGSYKDFGHRHLLVPMYISIEDNLAAVEDVEIILQSSGNRRLMADHSEYVVTQRVNSINLAVVEAAGKLMEPSVETPASLLSAIWETNTNAKIYRLRATFLVYDLEMMEKLGEFQALGANVR